MQSIWTLLTLSLAMANPIIEDSKLEKGAKLFHVQTLFKATFFQASMYCARLGMESVSFNSQREFDDAKEYIMKTAVPHDKWIQFWTAGAVMEPKKFGWMNTGLPVNLPDLWMPGEPNNEGNEECLEVKIKGDAGQMHMNDIRCSALNYIVCQAYKV